MRTRLPAVLLLVAWLLPVTLHASGVTGITATPSAVSWQAEQQQPVGRALPLAQVRTAHEVPGTAWHAVLASGAPLLRAVWHDSSLPGDDRARPTPRRCAPPARAPPSTQL
ncbi:hypothetical protein Aple_075560 [Acrocarpospora pleiomorpha]|uniref:Uncharacterized protein n=1 Tax=Acrocarpospora pleiomorpha TaxID=90975 RepID=A0A5M3XTT9_9ACTN|nr:hypothetical protein [Acrocarpospora pleiomorpha]GES24657.1 hypothetical protein Aple_075560 [Acrocarpospora pleiomorpha]